MSITEAFEATPTPYPETITNHPLSFIGQYSAFVQLLIQVAVVMGVLLIVLGIIAAIGYKKNKGKKDV